MEISLEIVNVAFVIALFTWVLLDIWRQRRRDGGDISFTHRPVGGYRVFTTITVLSNAIISILYLGFGFYEYWNHRIVTCKSVFLVLTWVLATVVSVYSKNRTLREDKRWPLVLILWWVFSGVFDSLNLSIYLITHISTFFLTSMPSTTSVLSAYTSFIASATLVRTVINEVQALTNLLIPQQFQVKLLSRFVDLFGNLSSKMTLIIDEYNGLSINDVYQASEVYLSTRITPSIEQLKVSKAPREKKVSVTINKGQKIFDVFDGIQFKWEIVHTETQKTSFDREISSHSKQKSHEHKSIKLSFHKRYKEKVLSSYLPYVLDRSKAIKEENKVVKLYSLGHFTGDYNGDPWGSINLDHPSTFDTLAMDPKLKEELMDDLDRFVKRREFYRRVGKAWTRGYLLYGPPGTGKSSLIAAMANYLKFDVYDLELTSLRSNSELRRLLVSTANRSIIVIEDIDCSMELQDRQSKGFNQTDSQLTLSGLLNFNDGLWSSCGDGQIIIFTTNYKEKLDPALLRPGRIDKHIHMSYCTPCGFKILASKYLGIKSHCLFIEIESLIKEVEVTPAEVAEELMKSEDTDIVLQGLVEFLRRKKQMKCAEESKVEGEKQSPEIEEKCEKKKVKKNKSKEARRGKGKR